MTYDSAVDTKSHIRAVRPFIREVQNCLEERAWVHDDSKLVSPEKELIEDMSLLDIVEMFCDWKAATIRHADGDIMKSIKVNGVRFKMPFQLIRIFENTVNELGWGRKDNV